MANSLTDQSATIAVAARPSPLDKEEAKFLLWCGQYYASGVGALVDVLSPVGEAAGFLSQGLLANETDAINRSSVHSFTGDPATGDQISQLKDPNITLGMKPHELLCARWGAAGANVTCKKLAVAGWGYLPIEVLYVGSARSWLDFEMVKAEFFRALIPGRGIVVLRDYVHTVAFWLHLFMEHYASYFEAFAPHIKKSSAAWRLLRPLPRSAFAHPLNEMLNVREMLQLMDRSLNKFPQPYATLITVGKIRLIAEAKGLEAAMAAADVLASSVADDTRALPHVTRLLAELKSLSARKPGKESRAFKQ